MSQYLIAGNWKMNTTKLSGVELASAIADAKTHAAVEVLVCPPFPYLLPVIEATQGSSVQVGAQNCYFEQPGAFTGEIAVEMLKDVGCSHVILGHSERRHVLGETDETINAKMKAALAGGLEPILCIGELLEEREANQTEAVLDRHLTEGLKDLTAEQMARVVIAYEPVWAIGTGKTATPEQAEEAHQYSRKKLTELFNESVAQATLILYGGSVKPANAEALLQQPNVNGALVGGASLSADNFVPIIEAAQALV